jgi:hypothetical protein
MLGKYERLDVLGHGVSGIVYLAKDTLLNKQVALKEVDVQAGDLRRFLEEARVMDRLRHPNIVRVNSVDRIDGKVIIDMEYVRGQNLQDILRSEGCLPMDRALNIAIQTLDALDYAHRMQTVHRDIKPANILIERDGAVKLVDFGLAEILATNAYAGGAGTYAYMAPEDFAEEDRSDSQSDIWAVGVTLYEMLTAHRPFQVAKVKDPFAWKRVLDTELPTPLSHYLPNASPALSLILNRALAHKKEHRYQTAGAFRDDLIRLQAGESLSTATLILPKETLRRVSSDYDIANGGAPHRAVAAPLPFPTGTRPDGGQNGRPPTVPGVPGFGPGMVVADVSADLTGGEHTVPSVRDAYRRGRGEAASEDLAARENPAAKRRSRLPFIGRKEARLMVEPESVDFGSVRKGELRTVRLLARVQGVEGPVEGRVLHTPGWLTVHPHAFDRARQAVTLTAHSARAWETGEFAETVRIETNAGTVEIPVRMVVLRSRRSFLQVAGWYVPLFFATLTPALAVAIHGGGSFSANAASLAPSAAVATGLMATMLLLIGVAADLGIAERVACGILMAVMCFVLGVSAALPSHNHLLAESLQYAAVTGGILGVPLFFQVLNLSKWKFWAVALGLLGLLMGGAFFNALMR